MQTGFMKHPGTKMANYT